MLARIEEANLTMFINGTGNEGFVWRRVVNMTGNGAA